MQNYLICYSDKFTMKNSFTIMNEKEFIFIAVVYCIYVYVLRTFLKQRFLKEKQEANIYFTTNKCKDKIRHSVLSYTIYVCLKG